MRSVSATVLAVFLGAAACSPVQPFPSDVMEGVDPNFDFSQWRMIPNQALERKIQLGGSILQSEEKTPTVTIVATQLPIVQHPAYGPKDTGKRTGEFAITFQGHIPSPFLQRGNRIIVVGTTKAAKVVTVDDIVRSLPSVSAKCLHIWNTGGRDIADFPSFGAGYETLEEETFCAKSQ
ncbi:MAG TPA: Slp family lipoprotein [Nitrospira sp.]|nr:Slp family lipoprotein [Nitrospira sp.]